jgi:hypothetical protein
VGAVISATIFSFCSSVSLEKSAGTIAASSIEIAFVTPETLTIMRVRRSWRRASRETFSRMK